MMTLEGSPLKMLIQGDQLTVNLGTICEDIARIISDNVDAWGGINQQSPWKGSVMTLEGLHMKTPYSHEISVLPHITCAAQVGN